MTAAFPLRSYQHEAIGHIRAAWQRGVRRQLVVLPTGSGKTVIFSHLARLRANAGRILVIAHREELIEQAADKIKAIAGDLSVGIVKAARNEHEQQVTVASIQTLAQSRRIAPLAGTVATVIIDEAHHATAKTYIEAMETLGCFDEDGPLTVGVTATAGRADRVGLKAAWQEIVYRRGILQMIADGYLVDVRALEVTSDLDLNKVQTRNGDYTDGSLGQAMEDSQAIEAAAVAYQRYAAGRRGIAFTPTVATAEHLATLLTARGIPAEPVCGKTPTAVRQAILRRLHGGETQVVTNCAVLTEGFDAPALSCALIARPTRSQPLFVQMAGRVLRLHPEKADALLLTMQAPPEAGLATIADLAGIDPDAKPVKPKAGESLAEAAVRLELAARTVSALTARKVNLFARSGLRWLPVPEHAAYTLPCGDSTLLLIPTDAAERYRVIAAPRGERPKVLVDNVGVDMAQGLGEEHARTYGWNLAKADAPWRKRQPSSRQIDTLRRWRIAAEPSTSGEASDAIAVAQATQLISRINRAGVAA